MTRHNLQSHLSWLLRTQYNVPGSPPGVPPSAGSSITLGAEPFTLSQFPSQTIESIELDVGLNPNTNGQSTEGGKEFVRPSLPASALHTTCPDAMGRLQSGSKSNTKPRLLSQVLPEVVQTTQQLAGSHPTISLSDQYNAAYSRNDAGRK